MKKPKDGGIMKKIDKQKKFYNVALKLIHEQGFKATTMRDIAKAMDFEVANVYNYTESKQAILENFLFDIADDFNDGLRDILNSSYATIDKLKQIISLYCNLPAQKPFQIGLLITEWRNLKDEKMKQFLDDRKWHKDQIIQLIQKGIEEGEIKKCDPYIITQTMLSSFNWLYTEYAIREGELNPVEIENQITAFIFDGLVKKEIDDV